jgi:hypothetical protein
VGCLLGKINDSKVERKVRVIQHLKKLSKRTTVTANAFQQSRIMLLMDSIRAKDAKLEFEHKYLLKFEFLWVECYIQINSFDGEYFVLNEEKEPIKIFRSILDIKSWLFKIIENPFMCLDENDENE